MLHVAFKTFMRLKSIENQLVKNESILSCLKFWNNPPVCMLVMILIFILKMETSLSSRMLATHPTAT